MKRWIVLVAFVVTGTVLVGPAIAGELPTVDELRARMQRTLRKVKNAEADMHKTWSDGNSTSVTDRHTVMMVRSVKGKYEGRREFVTLKRTTTFKDGTKITRMEKVVRDGTFWWKETLDANGKVIKATKTKAMPYYIGSWPEPLILMGNSKVVGEDTIDGQKMYVVEERHVIQFTNSKREKTKKLWVGQDDMLIHRKILATKNDDGRTSIETTEYTNLKVNGKVDEKLFKYTPPVGVEVKDYTKK